MRKSAKGYTPQHMENSRDVIRAGRGEEDPWKHKAKRARRLAAKKRSQG